MNNQIAIFIKPVGSYHFCCRLKKEGFRLYEYDAATDSKEAITDDVQRLIALNAHCDDITLIHAIYNGSKLPSIFTDSLAKLINVRYIAKITWQFNEN